MPKFQCDEDLIATVEAAQVLGCHIRTIHRLVRSGQLVPAVKIPGRTGAFLFRRRDVKALLTLEASA